MLTSEGESSVILPRPRHPTLRNEKGLLTTPSSTRTWMDVTVKTAVKDQSKSAAVFCAFLSDIREKTAQEYHFKPIRAHLGTTNLELHMDSFVPFWQRRFSGDGDEVS